MTDSTRKPVAQQQQATTQPQASEAGQEQQPTVDAAAIAAEAKAAEKARMASILQCEEAEGRSKLAQHFAYNTEMTVEEAKAALAAADAATPAANSNLLDAAMGNTKQPRIAADTGSADGDTPKPDASVALISDYRNATGRASK